MKKTKLIFAAMLTLAWVMPAQAQQTKVEGNSAEVPNFFKIRQEKLDAWAGNKPLPGNGYKIFKRWEEFWSGRVYPDGSFPAPDHNEKEWAKYQHEHPVSLGESETPANWTSLGPTNSVSATFGVGRVDCIAFHPTDPNTIWVGSPSGGLWKSTDGGIQWSSNTDNLVSVMALGISSIAIASNDPNTMYIATGDKNSALPIPSSVGILKSTDGGMTWNPTGQLQASTIYEVVVHPTNNTTVFAATSSGLYRSLNGGNSWFRLLQGLVRDVKFKPGSASMLYAVSKDRFFLSVNEGKTWDRKLNIPNSERIQIAVTPANNAIVALVSSTFSGRFNGFYTSSNSGGTFGLKYNGPKNLLNYDINGGPAGGDGQGWYDLAISISPTNANEVYIGGINLWKSSDGGSSWDLITYWTNNTQGKPVVHADIHTLAWQSNNTLFQGNDGGIYKSTNAGNSWTDLSNTLGIAQIARIGVSQTDNRILVGLQDNSTRLRENNGIWRDMESSGDGAEVVIDPTGSDTMFSMRAGGLLLISGNGGMSWFLRGPEVTPQVPPVGAFLTPFAMSVNTPDVLYAGYQNVWKSSDKGANWTTVSPVLDNAGAPLNSLVVAPTNPNIIYTATKTAIWRTTTGAAPWTNITAGLPTNSANISYLAVDPADPNKLYVTFSGLVAGTKVFRSTNGGASWTNISGTLPNVSANCIAVQPGGNDALYIGTDLGVFYRNASFSDWISYNEGLPTIIVKELECKSATNKIIAGTWGRGLWESRVYTVEQVNSLAVTPASHSVQTAAGSVTFNVTANVSWTVVANAPWLSCSPNTGTGNGTFTASFEENTSTMARTGTITVTGPVGVPIVTLTVAQAGVILPTCSTPTGLKASNITQTSAVLKWNAVSGAQSYSLQYRNLPAGVWVTPIIVPGVTQTVNGLQPGISYEWKVNTNCTNGLISSLSAPETFTTLLSLGCTAPVELTTSNITQNSASLSWAAVTGALNYQVQTRSLPNGAWTNTNPALLTGTSVLITGLQSDNMFEWRIQTNCTNGFPSAWSNVMSFKTLLPSSCNPPTNLATSFTTQNTSLLSWNAVPGALGYTIQFFNNGVWQDLTTLQFSTSYLRYGLWANTSYTWRVIANCFDGSKSNPSAEHTFSTLSAPDCQIGTKWPSNNLTPTSSWKFVTDMFGGNYTVFEVTAGTTYTFSFCASKNGVLNFDGEIFLRLSNGKVIAYRNNDCGTSPNLIWRSNFTGQVQVLLTKHECQSETIGSTMAYVIGSYFTDDDPEERAATGSETDELSQPALVVFPNPSSGNFTIQFDPGKDAVGSASIRVFNPLGYAAWERSGIFSEGVNTFEVDAEKWPNGMYLLQLLNEQGVEYTQRIYLAR